MFSYFSVFSSLPGFLSGSHAFENRWKKFRRCSSGGGVPPPDGWASSNGERRFSYYPFIHCSSAASAEAATGGSMKKWLTLAFSALAFGALVAVLLRWVMPALGLAGIEDELVQPLAGAMPWLVWLLLVAIALLVINLKWDSMGSARRRSRRLVEEAEDWAEDYRIGEEIPLGQNPAPQPAESLAEAGAGLANSAQTAPQPTTAPFTTPVTQPFTALEEAPPVAVPEAERQAERITIAAEEPVTEIVSIAALAEPPATQNPVERAYAERTAQLAAIAARSLHQLPPPPPEFTGRSFELDELVVALNNPENTSLGIQGLGGTGKTTLALKLAHHLAPHYPDAQFYLDLRGASMRPLAMSEAQAHVLRAYHPNAHLPESETELQSSYRAALAGKRALLLFDNAASAQQIAALVPPPGCLLIATSRQHFTLPGMFVRNLEVLTPSEAQELLLRLAPRLGEHAGQIARQCGYLPMALRLAAAALAGQPSLSPANYSLKLAQLSQQFNPSGPPKLVETVLRLSYELLRPGLQKLWRTLTVFPETFDVTGAAAVWGLHPARAAKALNRLIEHELVERNPATGRYRLHDLKHSFADEVLRDPERRDSQQRHSEYYQSVLHEADALYEQGGAALGRGLALVDLEWNNIEAGQIWATQNTERAARELCSSYPDAGRRVLDLRQHPRERIRWCEAALATASNLGRRKAEARHLLAMGRAYTSLSEAHHAIDCFEQGLEIARETNDPGTQARALNGLGAAYYSGGGVARAREFHEQALEIARTINDRRSEGNAVGGLGLVHYAVGEPRRALELLEQQLSITRETGDRRGESNALGGLGLAYYALGEAGRAIELLEQQLAITWEIGDRRGAASALSNLGNAHAELHNYEQSISFHQQALAIARESGDRRGEANAVGGIGIAWYLKGEVRQALKYLELQLRLTRETGDQRSESLALSNLGEACVALGDTTRAVTLLQRSFDLSSRAGDIQGQGYALFNLSLALDKRGDRQRALTEAETALELLEIAEHPYAETVRAKLAEWKAEATAPQT